MAKESRPFEDVSPIENGDFNCHVSSPEGIWDGFSWEFLNWCKVWRIADFPLTPGSHGKSSNLPRFDVHEWRGSLMLNHQVDWQLPRPSALREVQKRCFCRGKLRHFFKNSSRFCVTSMHGNIYIYTYNIHWFDRYLKSNCVTIFLWREILP